MSETFAYLSVLLSIVLGLAIAEILQGWASLLRARKRVRFYMPPLIWSLILLLITVQFWWVSFGLSRRLHWDFAAFCTVFAQTVAVYVAAAIVLPSETQHDGTNLREHYYRECRPLFCLGLLFTAVGFAKDWLLQDHLAPLRLGVSLAFSLILIVLLVTRRPRIHELTAPIIVATMIAYFGILFWRI